MKHYDVIVVGAGASGLMCAVEAAKRGRRVAVLDGGKRAGNKILISGGGRCNFTNRYVAPHNYLSSNPYFCVSALKRFQPDQFIKLIEDYKISYHEREFGRLFCNQSAQQIINLFQIEAARYGVVFHFNEKIKSISKTAAEFQFFSSNAYSCESCVIATGGISMKSVGASGFGYDIAKYFGLQVTPIKPGLVPLKIQDDKIRSLAGISLEAKIQIGNHQFQEALLFTHTGLSGPAVLQVSSYWEKNIPISINLVPNANCFQHLVNQKKIHPKQELKTALALLIPKRLAEYFANKHQWNYALAHCNENLLQQIADTITKWQLIPQSTAGYEQAEVTVGGIDTAELSSKTFESKKVNGLFFIGEVIDVTGQLGGYNLHWAWASGHAAGQFV